MRSFVLSATLSLRPNRFAWQGVERMDWGGMSITLGISLALSYALTFLVRWGALKLGWTHRPDPRKWRRQTNPHTAPIAMGGGFAILGSVVLSAALLPSPPFLLLLFGAVAFSLGFYDDLRSPRPIYRLLLQFLLASFSVTFIGWVKGFPDGLAILLSVVGIAGMMNSVNMMDNMDGVASGLMTLAMLGFAVLGVVTNNPQVTVLGVLVAGAALGFWWHNRPPARIFMGDAGSLLLGYLLAVTAILASRGEFGHWLGRVGAPFLLLSVFLTDTAFVVLWRARHGLPVMQGDRNHTSHRLAVLAGSEWRANLVLYTMQLMMGVCALGVSLLPPLPSALLILFAIALLALFAHRLWQVDVEDGESDGSGDGA